MVLLGLDSPWFVDLCIELWISEVVSICYKKELWWRVAATLTCGYKDKNIGGNLLLWCHFCSNIALHCHLASYGFLLKYGFHFVEQVLIPIGKWLGTHIIFMTLLHLWVYLAKTVIIVAFRVHNWIKLLMIFFNHFFWYYECHPSRCEDSILVPGQFILALWVRYLVSSAI